MSENEQEPVAWVAENSDGTLASCTCCWYLRAMEERENLDLYEGQTAIPLYTRPAPPSRDKVERLNTAATAMAGACYNHGITQTYKSFQAMLDSQSVYIATLAALSTTKEKE